MKRAILVVSFGTTYEKTRKLTIDKIEEKIKDRFIDWEIRRAFTAHRIITVLKDRDGIIVDTPEEALKKLKVEGYEEIIIQPLHLIPGEEYQYITNVVDSFKASFKVIKIGRPILYFKGIDSSAPDDYEIMVDAIKDIIPINELTIFMGHGSTHWANACYSCLQLVFRDRGYNNVFIANVEGYPSLMDSINSINKTHKGKKEVTLMPLMLVAGDHAENDMAGDDEDSWKNQLAKIGFTVNIYLHGLGEISKFQDIYIQHLEDVIEDRYAGLGCTKKGVI